MLLELVILGSVVGVAMPVQSDWRPINRPLPPSVPLSHVIPHTPSISYQSHVPEPTDTCTLYKASFDQDSPAQYVQFKAPIPDMKEFTLCMWHKFYNHSRDQPLFTYSSSHERSRDIYSWVSNNDRSSFYMLSVMGQTMYRLNYPVRLHKWYHSCQSWNGRTGEWQIWINSERIGRGFHNLLVGKTIKGGGIALSGQEPANNYINGYQDLYKPSGGLLGEVTLVQLYKAALTAGKAYTNHKHHHAHHFHHDDKLGDDDYRFMGANPAAIPENLQSNTGNEYPFLRHGQLIPSLPVHELSAFRGQQPQPPPQGSLNPQLNILGTSLIGPGQDNSYSLQHMRIYKRDQTKDIELPTTKATKTKSVIRLMTTRRTKVPKSEPLDTDEVDEMDEKMAFKREIVENDKEVNEEQSDEVEETLKREKRNSEEKKEKEDIKLDEEEVDDDKTKSKNKRQTEETNNEKVQKKRTAILGDMQFGVIPGTDLSSLFTGDGYILGGGGLKFNDDNNQSLEKDTDQAQMEPAEWEVRSIMAVCTGCSEDPFRKATIISWRETPKKLYSGVLYVPAIPECQRF